MIERIDVSLVSWFNSWVGFSSFGDLVIIFCAVYFGFVLAGATVFLYALTFLPRFRDYAPRHRELLFASFAAAFLSRVVVTELMRFFYYRPRPYTAFENIFDAARTSGSFPSGHAAFAFAIAATVSFYYPKTSVLFFVAAALIGVARVAAGFHWPTDIIGGAVVGVASAWFCVMVIKMLRRRLAPPS